MPELPEVETICASIQPMVKQTIQRVLIRQHQLRFEIPGSLPKTLKHKQIQKIHRRGKYLLFTTSKGSLLAHLGMSGRIRLYQQLPAAEKHDHVDIITDTVSLRFTDPRRFGMILWTDEDPMEHRLLSSLGVEPLSKDFNAGYLWQKIQHKKTAIKKLIMDSQIVVGAGNIYAAEALFKAGIHPQTLCAHISYQQCQRLVKSIRQVLAKAVACGGTTLKDFCDGHGDAGYFKQSLNVYGRQQQPCLRCGTILQKIIISQRSTVFCPQCQKL